MVFQNSLKMLRRPFSLIFLYSAVPFHFFDIGHAYKEVSKINLLNLVVMPKWPYDPNDVI